MEVRILMCACVCVRVCVCVCVHVTGSDATTGGSLWSEQHITIDVALGVWAAARSINSTAFIRDTAFPVLSNVADWICSRGTWTERGFEVLYMGGPDETTPKVNNSGYFNVGSMIVLQSAVRLGKQLGTSMGGHLDAKSLLKWEKTLAKFFVAKTPDGVSSHRYRTARTHVALRVREKNKWGSDMRAHNM